MKNKFDIDISEIPSDHKLWDIFMDYMCNGSCRMGEQCEFLHSDDNEYPCPDFVNLMGKVDIYYRRFYRRGILAEVREKSKIASWDLSDTGYSVIKKEVIELDDLYEILKEMEAK
jgi:hypothetical protein